MSSFVTFRSCGIEWETNVCECAYICVRSRKADSQKSASNHTVHFTGNKSGVTSILTGTGDLRLEALRGRERQFPIWTIPKTLFRRALTNYNAYWSGFLFSRIWPDRAVVEAEILTYFFGSNIIILETVLADWVVLSFEINLLGCWEQSSQNVSSCVLEALCNCWLRRSCSS